MSDEVEDRIPEEIEQVSAGCRDHARDLFRGAQKLREEQLPNLAFHLATLALEEIGKSELVVMGHLAGQRDRTWPAKHASDHVKKLFWAIWGPTFGRELTTKNQLESVRGFAQGLHELRMRGLYASADVDDFYVPRDTITHENLQQLLSLVENRLELMPTAPSKPLNEETKKDVAFFMRATEDIEKRRIIFSKASMEKLVELGTPRAWIRWLREQFEEADASGRVAAEKELKRREPHGTEAEEPKWQLKIRLFTNSHTIRQKALNSINDCSSWIKLSSVDKKKDQLLVELTFPKKVSIHALWPIGLISARRFVTALNIGSMGYFWWYVPEQISHYYEKLVDLESKSDVVVARSPALKIVWRMNPLSENDLDRTLLCFGMMPSGDELESHVPFHHYATGLALMSKTDIHFQFEPQAFGEFFEALKLAMRVYGDWDGSQDYGEVFHPVVSEIVGESDECETLFSLGERLRVKSPTQTEITLEEVGKIKIVCDAYFIRKFNAEAKRREETC